MLSDGGSESLRNLNLECSCTTFSRKKDRLQKYFLILEISLLKNNNPKSKPDEFASEIALCSPLYDSSLHSDQCDEYCGLQDLRIDYKSIIVSDFILIIQMIAECVKFQQ